MRVVGWALSRKLLHLFLYVTIVAGMGYLFLRMPTAYLPEEDQGILLAQVMLPTGSTLEQTQRVLEEIKEHFHQNEKTVVESILTVAGFGFSGRAQTNGIVWIKLKDWKLRHQESHRAKAIASRATEALMAKRNAIVFVFPPPAVIELGNARGFDFQLMDRGNLGHAALMEARNQLLSMASQDQRLAAVRPNGMEDVPEYRIDMDWERAGSLGLSISSIHNTISAAF